MCALTIHTHILIKKENIFRPLLFVYACERGDEYKFCDTVSCKTDKERKSKTGKFIIVYMQLNFCRPVFFRHRTFSYTIRWKMELFSHRHCSLLYGIFFEHYEEQKKISVSPLAYFQSSFCSKYRTTRTKKKEVL